MPAIPYRHTVKQTLETPGRNPSNAESVFTADGRVAKNIDIPNGETAFAVNVDFDIANLVSVWILSNRDITLKTNSSGAPDDEISLLAGVPKRWDNASGDDLFFTADVTEIFVLNASGDEAELLIEILHNSPEPTTTTTAGG